MPVRSIHLLSKRVFECGDAHTAGAQAQDLRSAFANACPARSSRPCGSGRTRPSDGSSADPPLRGWRGTMVHTGPPPPLPDLRSIGHPRGRSSGACERSTQGPTGNGHGADIGGMLQAEQRPVRADTRPVRGGGPDVRFIMRRPSERPAERGQEPPDHYGDDPDDDRRRERLRELHLVEAHQGQQPDDPRDESGQEPLAQ